VQSSAGKASILYPNVAANTFESKCGGALKRIYWAIHVNGRDGNRIAPGVKRA